MRTFWLECKYCHIRFEHHKIDHKRFLCPSCWRNRYMRMSPRIDPWILHAHWDKYQHLLHLPGEPLHNYNCLCCGRYCSVSMFERYKYACSNCFHRIIKPMIEANDYTHQYIINNWHYLKNHNYKAYSWQKKKGMTCIFGDNSTSHIIKLKFNI